MGRRKAWQAAPWCLFWTIWMERNGRAFLDMAFLDKQSKGNDLSLGLVKFINSSEILYC